MLRSLLNSMSYKDLIKANSILFLDHVVVVNFNFLFACNCMIALSKSNYILTYILSQRLRGFPWSATWKHELFIWTPFISLHMNYCIHV